MSKGDEEEPTSPWLKGVRGVKGIVPPGRRLSPQTERRKTKWSASGVNGVTPPGNLGPKEGPSVDWAERADKKKQKVAKENRRNAEGAKRGTGAKVDPMRPTVGIEPNIFKDSKFPDSVNDLFKEINKFVWDDKPDEFAAREIGQLITQSKAPFEIVSAFAVLQGICGTDEALREFFGPPLERGATVLFNLLKRLDPSMEIPHGFVVQTVDPIFYDLPTSAMHVPFAFTAYSFIMLSEILDRGVPEYDEKLKSFRLDLYERYIEGHSLADEPLERMFPWDPEP